MAIYQMQYFSGYNFDEIAKLGKLIAQLTVCIWAEYESNEAFRVKIQQQEEGKVKSTVISIKKFLFLWNTNFQNPDCKNYELCLHESNKILK